MRTIVAAGLLFFFARAEAQNLVPNPSFEDTLSNPNWGGYLPQICTSWLSPLPGTSDCFNDSCYLCLGCASTLQPPRTGYAFGGFYTFDLQGVNFRECVEVKLLDTLKAGRQYCVEFYVSRYEQLAYACGNMGAYFSAAPITTTNNIVAYTPQINHDPMTDHLIDGTGWTRIAGTFIATGGELYLTITNFTPDSNMDSARVSGDSTSQKEAYYFIDDISVIEIADCNAGNDAVICFGDSIQLGITSNSNVIYAWSPTTGLNDPMIANPKASPFATMTYTLTQTQCDVVSTSIVTVAINNDCSAGAAIVIPTILYGDDQLKIQGLESNSLLDIFDSRGRKVFATEDYQNDFRGNELSQAMYFVRLTRPNGEVMQQKLCIIK